MTVKGFEPLISILSYKKEFFISIFYKHFKLLSLRTISLYLICIIKGNCMCYLKRNTCECVCMHAHAHLYVFITRIHQVYEIACIFVLVPLFWLQYYCCIVICSIWTHVKILRNVFVYEMNVVVTVFGSLLICFCS